jgi:tetratricopeptide (TPR) repeat protein
MRKIASLMTLLLLAGTLRVFAQDATPTPVPSTQSSQQQQVPGFIGLDIFNRAGQALQAQKYQQALADYSLFILLNPTGSQAYYPRAVTYTQLDDLTSALADVNHALALPAPSPELTGRMYGLRALIYLNQDETDKALTDLNAGIEADPSLPSLYLQRGRIYANQNRLQDAVTDFGKVIELAPSVPDGYALRAAVNAQLQNYEAALTDYNQLIIMTPNDPTPYTARARVYLQQKKYEPALADLNDALRLSPTTSGLYLLRGEANNQLGNQADAAKDYFEWVRSQQTDINTDLTLRPGESQVVELANGKFYIMEFSARGGQKVTLTARAHEGETTDPLLVLLDAKAAPLVADDDSGGNFDAAIADYALPADGIYGVVVGYSGGGTHGPVRVLLEIAQ